MIQLYIYRHCFSYSFPLWFITGYWIQFPVLYSRILLFIHSIYNSLHLLIPDSQSFPCLPPYPSTVSLLFLCVCVVFSLRFVFFHTLPFWNLYTLAALFFFPPLNFRNSNMQQSFGLKEFKFASVSCLGALHTGTTLNSILSSRVFFPT